MVNLSQGIDKLLEGQSKISEEIRKVRELQYDQLVSVLDSCRNLQVLCNAIERRFGET
jgi:hypothetical protein